jgi:hypothetical protein
MIEPLMRSAVRSFVLKIAKYPQQSDPQHDSPPRLIVWYNLKKRKLNILLPYNIYLINGILQGMASRKMRNNNGYI